MKKNNIRKKDKTGKSVKFNLTPNYKMQTKISTIKINTSTKKKNLNVPIPKHTNQVKISKMHTKSERIFEQWIKIN